MRDCQQDERGYSELAILRDKVDTWVLNLGF